MNSNKIAVILVNYNGITDSIDCIESLYKTTSPEELSIIFVDNASKNDEAKIIEKNFPEAITIRSENNGGFSVGNNIGIKYALTNDYGYILLLNNDTVVAPDMIELLKSYCTDSSIAVPKMLYYSNPNVIWYGGGFINRKTGNAEHINMNCIDTRDTTVKNCTFASGCCMMIKANTFKVVGLLDEDYFMYCEDTEFCIRLLKNGIRIKYIPTAKLWHKVSQSTGGSDSAFSTYYMTRNRLNYIKKYCNEFSWTAYPFSLLTRYIRMITCKDKKKKQAFRQGIHDHIKAVTGKVSPYL